MDRFSRSMTYFIIPFLFLTASFFQVEAQSQKTFKFNFGTDTQGWVGDFAEYFVGAEASFNLSWGWANLPTPLPNNEKGIFLSGFNMSDDLTMFIKRQIRGLSPNTNYDLTFKITIETNIPPGIIGIGGSPGEGVFFKVGASRREPIKVPMQTVTGAIYRLNIDIGFQSQGGRNAIVIGNLANPAVNPLDPTFEPKILTNTKPFRARTDAQGRLWLFVGTDSGFEGSTLYYITKVCVKAKRVRGVVEEP